MHFVSYLLSCQAGTCSVIPYILIFNKKSDQLQPVNRVHPEIETGPMCPLPPPAHLLLREIRSDSPMQHNLIVKLRDYSRKLNANERGPVWAENFPFLNKKAGWPATRQARGKPGDRSSSWPRHLDLSGDLAAGEQLLTIAGCGRSGERHAAPLSYHTSERRHISIAREGSISGEAQLKHVLFTNLQPGHIDAFRNCEISLCSQLFRESGSKPEQLQGDYFVNCSNKYGQPAWDAKMFPPNWPHFFKPWPLDAFRQTRYESHCLTHTGA